MALPGSSQPVHRPSDGELVGFVAPNQSGQWSAFTVFGVVVQTFMFREAAQNYLMSSGLAVMAQPWWLWSRSDERWRRATLVEAGPGWVTVRCGLDPKSTDVRTLRDAEVDDLRPTPPDHA